MVNFPVTPHMNVQDEIGFGKTALMSGDPLRAKLIAENFLKNTVLSSNIRGVNGDTGGKRFASARRFFFCPELSNSL
jgi:purine-nucleoside phosphorylase